ncbi:MAG TPA: NUDIX domain-containing protein [Firmicutes bacterium]|nr:NUDIX domain-containing protein [Bacillota bacterium]
MRLIKEISHDDIGLAGSGSDVKYRVRKAARAVLCNEAFKIALMYVAKDGYYKLPGGGLENGESVLDALRREIYEEVGCGLQILQKIGVVIEYREQHELLQISYNFLCKTEGELAHPRLTAKELKLGFNLVWFDINGAIGAVSAYTGEKYVAKFITSRDVCILRQAKTILGSRTKKRSRPHPQGE